MDNIFRIKRQRDTTSSSKKSDVVSGTLDSVHQTIVTGIRDETTNVDELRVHLSSMDSELESLGSSTNLSDILKSSKLRDDIKYLKERLDQTNPLTDYYLKNADIMLKYYGSGEKVQHTSVPADQNTFVKYLSQTNETEYWRSSRSEEGCN